MAQYDHMEGIAWRWQCIDWAMYKTPLAEQQVGPNPTDRGRNGSKLHHLVDGSGAILSFILTGARRHDVTQLDAVLSLILVKCEVLSERRSKHLCLEAGYRCEPALKIIKSRGYLHLVASHTQEKESKQFHLDKKARRWSV